MLLIRAEKESTEFLDNYKSAQGINRITSLLRSQPQIGKFIAVTLQLTFVVRGLHNVAKLTDFEI